MEQLVFSYNFLNVFEILPGASVLLVFLICNLDLTVLAEGSHLALGLKVM